MNFKRKFFVFLAVLTLLLCCTVLFAACDDEVKTTESETVESETTDGETNEDETKAPETDKNTYTAEKEAQITGFSVELLNTRYTLVDGTVTVTYGENYGLSFDDFSVIANFDNGTDRTLTASELNDYGFTFESNIPSGEKTPVGSYSVSIKNKSLEVSKTVTLVVEKATVNYSKENIKWSKESFVYDGTEKSVTVINLPIGLSVTYQNNAQTNIGEYTATATVSATDSANYRFEEITVTHSWKIEPLSNYKVTLKVDGNPYKVIYASYGDNIDDYNPKKDVYSVIGVEISKAKEHYTFAGWYTKDGRRVTLLGEDVILEDDIVLEAKWTPTVYTITYKNTENAENSNPTTYTVESEAITLADLADRVDYTFLGWYYNGAKITSIPKETCNGNMELEAKWEQKQAYRLFGYTVDGNGNVTITEFYSGVTKIIIPEAVTAIADNAFEGNSELLEIIFEDGTKPLTIGKYAFSKCKMTSITIPARVTEIGDYAFYENRELLEIIFEDGTNPLTIGKYAFSICKVTSITIPARATEIGEYAFSKSALFKITFADNCKLTTIGSYAFNECEWLTEVTVPDSVVRMGKGVFNMCIGMTKVVFGKGMTVIGENIYGSSAVLKEMEFKGEIKSVHKNAFSNLATKKITLTLNWNQKDLTQEVYVTIGGGPSYGDNYIAQGGYYRATAAPTAFCAYTFGKICLTCDATGMTADEFSSNLGKCDTVAFTNLKFILPASANDYFQAIKTLVSKYGDGTVSLTVDGATSIPENAFEDCKALKEVVIGDSVESIEDLAFANCKSLLSIVIPSGVTLIDQSAFWQRDGVFETVYYMGTAAQWNDIAIKNENFYLTNVATRYYYSEAQPTEEGNWWHYVNGVPTVWSN